MFYFRILHYKLLSDNLVGILGDRIIVKMNLMEMNRGFFARGCTCIYTFTVWFGF